MQAEEREPDSLAAARRYGYFRLLRHLREQGLEPRMHNELSLAFPVADVAGCDGSLVRPAFMGLLGVAGSLPFHYSERIFASADDGARAFVDMLSARALEQFDESWHKHRPSRDSLVQMLLALGGAQDEALAQFAGMTRRPTVSADAVGRALSAYFAVAVRVEQFVGRWEMLAASDRPALGAANVTLGGNAALGERQWRYGLHIRIHVGPLDANAYADFLPGGPGTAALRRMVAGLTGIGAGAGDGDSDGTSAYGCPGCLGGTGRVTAAERVAAGDGRTPCAGGAGSEGPGVEVWVALGAGVVKGAMLDGRVRVGYNAFLLTSDRKEPRSELRYRL